MPMPTLAKKNLPASMAKSTLPEVLTLKLPEDGKSITVLPVALLGRDSDGCGVLIFGDSDGNLPTLATSKPKYSDVTMLASESRGITAGAYSEPSDVSEYREANFFLNVVTPSGFTLTVSVQTLDPVSGGWSEVVAFDPVTGDTEEPERKTVDGNLGSSIRIKYIIADTSVTFSVGAVLKS